MCNIHFNIYQSLYELFLYSILLIQRYVQTFGLVFNAECSKNIFLFVTSQYFGKRVETMVFGGLFVDYRCNLQQWRAGRGKSCK